ncbi:PAS domain S-box-containing protein [Chitinophaga rupis]|uniref:histidine kinase n=1 Tax=Chitinophaga rupis TaxID=573321 RepID=A0A1H7PL05_9BACT|nr:PAS domain-containing sensor histidine kinase [Chitinophaga rupis]SEL36463.1 PAS domain S-box-containing protein [Chitinophaga rupis]
MGTINTKQDNTGAFQDETAGQTNEERLFQKIVEEQETCALIFLDKEGIIKSWNKGAGIIKGYSRSEAIGKYFDISFLPEDRAANIPANLLKTSMLDGKAVYEGWCIRKDASKYWGQITVKALYDEKGQLLGFSELALDLSLERAAAERSESGATQLRNDNQVLNESGEMYQGMIAEIQDYAIIRLDANGVIRSWNLGAEKIKGYRAEEILGKHFSIFYEAPDKANGLPQKLIECARHTGSAKHEGWRVRKDGSRFWGSIVITALHAGDGTVIGFTKVTRDLTEKKLIDDELKRSSEELKRSIAELRKSEERYHKMVQEVQDYAIIMLDEEGNVISWNIGAERIKGYQAKEIIGVNFRIFYPPRDKEAGLPEKLIQIAAKNGKATHEGWRVRKDGSRFWGSITITALHGGDNSIIGYSKVTRDLTERKFAEDKMKDYVMQLENKNWELEQFAYVASHDMQEPLRKIQTFTDIIQNNPNNQAVIDKYFPKINISAKRMSMLIKSILDYSRLDKVKHKVHTDLNKVLESVRFDLELMILERNAIILHKPLPAIDVYPDLVSQLFTNILGNALKYCDGQPVIKIASKFLRKEDIKNSPPDLEHEYFLELSFQDNGIGFEQQYAEVIFAIFQRLHARDKYEGTGIGLAMCKRIMKNHSGFIRATGEPGKGACFYTYFPVSYSVFSMNQEAAATW